LNCVRWLTAHGEHAISSHAGLEVAPTSPLPRDELLTASVDQDESAAREFSCHTVSHRTLSSPTQIMTIPAMTFRKDRVTP
jgi:hypothetical protein